jgi:hypothetical protein
MRAKINTWLSISALLVAVFSAVSVAIARPLAPRAAPGGAPTTVSYQGRVEVSGAPFDGTGYFKFAITDPAGANTFWSNDGSSSVGDEPINAVALPVNHGLFSVLLGDNNLINMSNSLTASVFRGSDRVLRVWFSDDNVTFTLLLPDTPLASVPYALQAEEARNADYHYYPLMRPQYRDLSLANPALVGFSGGFTDGSKAFFVPFQNCQAGSGPATIGAQDLQDFGAGSIYWLDLSAVDSSLRCFLGGFTDGRYGYLVPFEGTKIVRFDLQNFATGGVTWLDLATINSNLRNFNGGFTDGRYGYLVPYYGGAGNTPQGKLVRFDLDNFTTAGVTWFDLQTIAAGLTGFSAGFTDGRYGYLVPGLDPNPHGRVVRFDLQDFTTNGVTVLDLAAYDTALVNFYDGFTDGRFAYFAAQQGLVVRLELQDFTPSGISVLNLTSANPALTNFLGAFTDGRYGYFLPYNGDNMARVDLQDFHPEGVTWLNLAADGTQKNFFSGFTDRHYAYFVPFSANSNYYGTAARIQLFSGTNLP